MHEDRSHSLTADQCRSGPIQGIAFFFLVFLYLYAVADPKLLYFGHGTVVKLDAFSSWEALRHGMWTRPGGLGSFVPACLLRSFGIGWVGPAAITLIALLLFLAAERLTTSAYGKPLRGVGYIPVILLLGLVSQYRRPFFCLHFAVPLVFAMLLAAAYTRLPSRTIVRLAGLGILSVIVYLVGAGALLPFAATCAVVEIVGCRRPFLGSAAIIAGAAVPCLLGRLACELPWREAYLALTPFDPTQPCDSPVLSSLLFSFIPMEMAASWSLRWVRQRFRAKGSDELAQNALPEDGFAWNVESLALLIVGSVVLVGSFRRGFLLPFRGADLREPLAKALTVVAALALALFAVRLYTRATLSNPWARWGIFAVLLAVVHCFAAGCAALAFGILCALYELYRRPRVLAVACFAWLLVHSAFLVEMLGMDWGHTCPEMAVLVPGWSPLPPPVANKLLSILPFAAAVLSVWRSSIADGGMRIAELGTFRIPHSEFRIRMDRKLGPFGSRACHFLLLVVVAGAALSGWFDWQTHARLRLNYFARMGQWEDVLNEAHRLARPDDAARLDMQRALYHRGRLAEDMLAYPCPRLDRITSWSWPELSVFAEMYLDMGHLNAAEEYALANLALGEHPLVLRALGRVYLAEGKLGAAHTFYSALRRDRSCGRWADEYFANPNVAGQAKKGKKMGTDRTAGQSPFFSGFFSQRPSGQIKNVFELSDAEPSNRMAFEFKMAWLLLLGRLDEFVANLPKANQAGCRGRMRLYQEAFLEHEGDADAEAAGIEIAPETRQRFRDFQAACASARTAADYGRIAHAFGDTYFFYHRFGGGVRP